MITVTERAKEKILDILAEENRPEARLRCFVQGGGCSGFTYGFTLDDTSAEDDFVIDFGGSELLVDSMSAQYLQGSEINYKEDLMGCSFVINNPNASGTCGCGSSFSV